MSDAIGPKPLGEVEIKTLEGRKDHISRADLAELKSRLSDERPNLTSMRHAVSHMRVSSSSTEGSSARPVRWKSAAIAVNDASQTVFKGISKISPE